MKVFLTFLGCKTNRSEQEAWEREFVALGHEISSPEEADFIVINTCTVTSAASHKSRQLIRRMHRLNPAAKIVVTGCYAEIAREEINSIEGVSLVVKNSEKEFLPQILVGARAPWAPPLSPSPGATRAFVKVQDGCNNYCTYCIIRVARGRERSRPLSEVVEEVKRLAEAGYKEVVLTGIHLGGYGCDLGVDLASLIKAVLEETPIQRLRLSSIEPWDIPPGFFSLWQDRRLCRHLHLPLQSGCDETLKRMGRRYTAAQYAHLVEEARSWIPDLAVTTDVMVGFPGETWEEFRQSLEFIKKMEFARIHVFPYSPRPGTPAAAMKGQVSGKIKREREKLVAEVGKESERAFQSRFLGRTMEVLWETPEHREGKFLCSGLTDNYIRVFAFSPCPLSNVITPVRLVALGEEKGPDSEGPERGVWGVLEGVPALKEMACVS
ncbi:MAG: tRNA (N(6)-L-threonylcarbamoyladenosine(37)-C(2))-methylthiotransferase MtaB [Anaerolineae bacterium]|nr:tRNA (N(6)-L-threonylcarbamoyladenosine(37)-C(2))-methylthiotransferase MtaB [Anaerolineae bacterium]MDW8101304.1 tRNA (N(6)-L-threonylcarbamoyladenosine(37)-C(2))-methylthiotransferase MtaB [Anaerolineae bacterium]